MNQPSQPSIIPAIATIGSKQIACLEWIGQADKQVMAALREDRELFTSVLSGIIPTAYGNMPFLLVWLDEFSQVERNPDDLYCFDLLLNPIELSHNQKQLQWLQLLKHQDSLGLKVTLSQGMGRIQPVVSGAALRRYIAALEQQIPRWLLNKIDYFKVAGAAQRQLDAVIQEHLKMLRWQYSAQRTPLEKLMLAAYDVILEEFPLEHPLYKEADRHEMTALIEGLSAHYKQWRSLDESAQHTFLTGHPEDSTDGILRSWVFAQHCLELSAQHYPKGIVAVAKGCTADGRWIMHRLPGKQAIARLFLHGGLYRYLLAEDWGRLMESQDAPCSGLALCSIYGAGKIPDRETFGNACKILQSALANQQYGIHPLSTIIVRQPGCEEIVFLPSGHGNRHCLFKVIVQERENLAMCLFGRLDALKGTLTFARYPDLEEADCLRLYGFLVAIAYRDLVVCEQVLQPELATTLQRSSNKTKSSRRVKAKAIQMIARKRYLAPIECGLSPNFADPARVVKQVLSLMPHLRTFHPRQLPSGQQASAKQRELAAQYGIELGEGETFVKEALVGGGRDESEQKLFRSLSLLRLFFS